ncbi:MAG: type II secretion system protein GspM [Pseudomonadota bacterium]
MTAWWDDLVPRERLLVLVAGALTVLVSVWVFVVVPSLAANENARIRYQSSALALDTVATGLAQIEETQTGAQQGGDVELDADHVRWRVIETAQFLGLAPNQLRSETDGSVSAVFRDADPRLVFAYVQLLSTRESIVPRTASISRSENGRVVASFEFVGGPS